MVRKQVHGVTALQRPWLTCARALRALTLIISIYKQSQVWEIEEEWVFGDESPNYFVRNILKGALSFLL
jgi:hypothetical protein